uniref:Hypothetcal protein n=1 Tax=Trypanosoma brucei brucei (strain 927/4 GUTat10.1) TaxID=185431 RepID=B2ZWB9_TRYB2|nr:hypothetcal protein [Trypanosoma brucei brucei TREU927]
MGRHHQQVGAVNHVDVKPLIGRKADMPWDMREPSCRAVLALLTRKNYRGHIIIRRSQGTRAVSEEEERTLLLQEVNVRTLSLERVRRQMKDETRQRFDNVWNLMIATERNSKERDRESHLRNAEKDAVIIKEAGTISYVSDLPTKGRVSYFFQLWRKRRRFIVFPKVKKGKNDYGSEVPLNHIFQYISAVYGESAALFDLKAFFFQVNLPQETFEWFSGVEPRVGNS